MEWTQEYTRERVRVLEMLAELRHLEDLRAKREARAAQRVVIAVAAGLRADTSEPLECDGDVEYRGVDGIPVMLDGRKGVDAQYTEWRHWEGGLDRA
jgi:hypothetical protein